MIRLPELAQSLLDGDVRSLAQAISLVEMRAAGFADLLAILFPLGGHAHIVGIAGAPGVGKSTLITALAHHMAATQQNVAVLAVDPTSSLTGGALLGDRIRMSDLALHDRIFIRSLATRGMTGGLSHAVWDAVSVLDAAGYDPILIETVGSGQSEVQIHTLAHTTVLVDAPGLGDSIQALKAGLLEGSDIVVVNKSDLPGCRQAAVRIRQALRLAVPLGPDTGRDAPTARWEVPVLTSCAPTGEGIETLQEQLAQHHAFLHRTGRWQALEQDRYRYRVDALLAQAWQNLLAEQIPGARKAQLVQAIQQRQMDPYAAAQALLDDVLLTPHEGEAAHEVM